MRRRRHTLRNEQGVALILSIMVLLCFTGSVLGYLAVSPLEPQISRNLSDATRLRYLTEAAIEAGYNVLTKTGVWNTVLGGATGGAPWVALAGLTNAAITGATNGGTFSVTVRNDNGAADTPFTGLSSTTVPPMDSSPTAENNGVLIMRSTAPFNGATKTPEVVPRRTQLPPFPGAANTPWRQADTQLNPT